MHRFFASKNWIETPVQSELDANGSSSDGRVLGLSVVLDQSGKGEWHVPNPNTAPLHPTAKQSYCL
jgi:hypothetical protein